MATEHIHAPGAPVAPDFLAAMERSAIRPLWDRYHKILRAEPRAPDAPWLWRWSQLQGFIDRAAAEVSMDEAERRVLMLINPGFGGQVITTTNLFAGIQILEPGESARPHRHTASAMRFVIAGEGGATIVDGQNCPMVPGDLILTPNWAWHEHVNHGTSRVVWLDALDLPLTAHLDAIFAEGASGGYRPNISAFGSAAFTQGGVMPDTVQREMSHSPMFRYSWSNVLAALDATPGRSDGSHRVRYTNPVSGGPVMPTMDCYAWRIAGGRDTARYRTTANAVCLVVDGEGESRIGEKTLRWQKHDVFTVPHWNWASHRATNAAAHLFFFTDREILAGLSLLREEGAA
ncbi:MAG TPA: cupin domain-containing protein [Stellaceae bacterium]|nr:cupin domain-containing protein [Stellaceae bacterium]